MDEIGPASGADQTLTATPTTGLFAIDNGGGSTGVNGIALPLPSE